MHMLVSAFLPQEHLLGLTERSHLYAGDTEVCSKLPTTCLMFVGSEEAAAF